MRYWTHVQPGEAGVDEYITYSEDEIYNMYKDHWYTRMCDKFGKEYVDECFGRQDCIGDWIVVHWAWESTDVDLIKE